ncbi:tetracycline regulation of excision, RteC [Flavobacterium psychrophilum]|uniref:Tetracycline regulation of excision, RteC n=1 Tax=Flavobacterium psychrophilum (strain ATCC 49511 / DSM 21280 / CIP 103535 / JIP02/86) TaxID=402612 RepID=A6GZT5_FLAPJ|nr:RteC domain-containing protein [Flavobacterium psychrophilum]AIG30305.1 tetracycline regulation of excision, RteC [Flavobacterium psychrophilum]AIG32580.1 tetracycline regulation of excision, RteC [Flavobacterium psychrophilum]AIG34735.1 tetracycline regulation of excision, RteC [Flavobacterium psychrophilum]AIG37100.1 tetracycline regulation of excision, RteC [Flavobacterium psychrophilum]AIG39364.1 tetracycline regulation of excision, RteC [Flavobacterium psychrophilum]
MNSKINLLLSDLNEQLNFIDLEIDDTLKRCEKAIEIIIKSIQKLKILFLKENFKNQEQEIDFFKNIKPKFTSKLVYYNIVYKIETKNPYGGERVVKKYLNNELDKLKRYFDNNLDFYKYYRTGNNYLDFKYFVRGNFDVKLTIDSFFFEVDHNFSTSHDFKVAKILAHDLVQVYLEAKLLALTNKGPKEKSQHNHNTKLTWTAPKVALIELLYALQSEKVFNNGTTDLKEIAEYFENIFNVDLGQYRRTFLEIRVRKTERAKFLNTLKDALEKRMSNSDESV